ncbi:MAG TPA: hypothetical protein VMW04_01305, partial [Patescibacteria group bacterium]|nr:hypothetical protein [Patescibacteria group bacterium]
AGWSGCSDSGVVFVSGKGCTVFDGLLKNLSGDVLHATQWGTHATLVPGNSFTMTLEVGLPSTAGSALQGKSTTFDLLITGYNPHR